MNGKAIRYYKYVYRYTDRYTNIYAQQHGAVGAKRGTLASAMLSAGPGERASYEIPRATARLAGSLSGPLRRLQTGMAHHAYIFLIVGLAAAVLLMLLGG